MCQALDFLCTITLNFTTFVRGHSYYPILQMKNLKVRKFQSLLLSLTQWGSQNLNLGEGDHKVQGGKLPSHTVFR